MERKNAFAYFSEASIRGRRYDMEDAHIVIPEFRGPHEFYAGVFDGHSGSWVADMAAGKLHTYLQDALDSNSPQKALHQAFINTDADTLKHRTNGGSTAVVAYANGASLYVANAGDARAVLDRAGVAKRLSHDHKADNKNEMKRIQRLGGFVTPKSDVSVARVNGMLAISRSLGDHFVNHHFSGVDYITAKPNIREVELREGDSTLILACDGVWDVLSDKQAIEVVAKGKGSSTSQAEILVDEAYNKGSQDNITALVINLRP